ncbi:MAG TPA: N-acetylmuramoyl-L-alanine amidase [Candidatus Acidoferrales bacterium]|nr:N-acetylmuramoyl-L-alanine amidase [Candidatus Acidoferrales bacterium]
MLLSTLAPLARAAPPPPAGAPSAPVARVDGVPSIGADDFARLLGGVQFWRSDTRKLVIRAIGHRMTFTVDVPIVILDDRTLRLDAPVRSRGGELQIPVSLLTQLPRDTTGMHLVLEAGGTRVRLVPAGGLVGPPVVSVPSADVTRLAIATAHAEEARVMGRGRGHFRIWLPGAAAGPPPDSLPPNALVRRIRAFESSDGVTYELQLAPEVQSYRLVTPARREQLALELSRVPGEGESFAPEGPPGPRALHVVVLDPGHGGADAGVQAGGVSEKDLTLALARQLTGEIEARTGARVLLTRTDDRALAPDDRAEFANRSRADLVIALHFDGVPGTRARGASLWCPPASYAGESDASAGLPLMPWRDVALRHAVESRDLADDIASALDAHGLGPARVRERLPVALLGVNAPGLVLECATLTSPDDLARVTAPDGLHDLAVAIAEGVLDWSRH